MNTNHNEDKDSRAATDDSLDNERAAADAVAFMPARARCRLQAARGLEAEHVGVFALPAPLSEKMLS